MVKGLLRQILHRLLVDHHYYSYNCGNLLTHKLAHMLHAFMMTLANYWGNLLTHMLAHMLLAVSSLNGPTFGVWS